MFAKQYVSNVRQFLLGFNNLYVNYTDHLDLSTFTHFTFYDDIFDKIKRNFHSVRKVNERTFLGLAPELSSK